ncbi:MAG TPA: NAD-dependent epimerase/dehydratase family protein [Candidatus Binatia bacterium]|nr:NAD-dependent epimerase/dehydratase family protein [Candidatus Binatia bacterium]
MSDSKVLITGGLGFLGRHIAALLARDGRRVLLFDNLDPQVHGTDPGIDSLALLRNPRVEMLRADVRRSEDWEQALHHVGQIVHLAARTGTAQSMYEITGYTETNVGGTAALLNYLANRRHSVTRIVLASSRAVYGEGAYRCPSCGVVYPPMRSPERLRAGQWEPPCPQCQGAILAIATAEDARLAPVSTYAATKVAQEELVRVTCHAIGVPAVILRLQNVYGEGQSLRNPYTGILSIFSNQLRLGKAVELYEDGQESRDFVHVSDIARAVVLSLAGDAADGCTLNAGSGRATSVAAVASLLREHFAGSPLPVISGRYRLGDTRHGFADISAIQARLGWRAEVSLEQGLDRFVEWVRSQPPAADRLGAASQELQARGLMLTHQGAAARACAGGEPLPPTPSAGALCPDDSRPRPEPDLSVIIASYNTCALLRQCLQSIYQHTTGISFEVICLDDNSPDGSAEMVAANFPEVRLVRNTVNRFYAQNNNLGMRMSRGRYACLLNGDTVLTGNAFQALVRFMDEHPDVAACGPRLLNVDGTVQHCVRSFAGPGVFFLQALNWHKLFPKSRLVDRYYNTSFDYSRAQQVDSIGTTAYMIRRSTWEEAGMLDERFRLAVVDLAYNYMLKHKGCKVYYTPCAEIIHLGSQSINQNALASLRDQRRALVQFSDAYDYFGSGAAAKLLVRVAVGLRYYSKVLGYYLGSDKRVIKGPGAPRREQARRAALLREPGVTAGPDPSAGP